MVTLLRLCAVLSAISGVVLAVVLWPETEVRLSRSDAAMAQSDCVIEAIRANRSTAHCDFTSSPADRSPFRYVLSISWLVSGSVSALVFAAIAAILDHVATIRDRSS